MGKGDASGQGRHAAEVLRDNWYWLVLLGAVLVIAGLTAIVAPAVTGVGFSRVLGGVLAVSGIFQLAQSLRTGDWTGNTLAFLWRRDRAGHGRAAASEAALQRRLHARHGGGRVAGLRRLRLRRDGAGGAQGDQSPLMPFSLMICVQRACSPFWNSAKASGEVVRTSMLNWSTNLSVTSLERTALVISAFIRSMIGRGVPPCGRLVAAHTHFGRGGHVRQRGQAPGGGHRQRAHPPAPNRTDHVR